MIAPKTPTVTLTDAPVNEGLQESLEALVKGGYDVYVYQSPHRRSGTSSWFLIEKDGNTGIVQHTPLDGYRVLFSIDPNRGFGSSLMVGVPGPGRDDRDPIDLEDILICAALATGSEYRNFATSGALPNHGWKHFEWAVDGLVQVIA